MTTAREIILAVMNDVRGVAKKDKNTHQGFNFRGIDAVVNKIGPALREHGGFIVPTVLDKSAEIMNGKLNLVRLTVEFAVYGSEGEPVRGTVASEAFDSGDKATSKAMSVAFRTFLLQTLALPTDEPDPDSFTYEIPARDWVAEAEAFALVYDVKALRNLYAEMVRVNAPADQIKKVKDYGKDVAEGSSDSGSKHGGD